MSQSVLFKSEIETILVLVSVYFPKGRWAKFPLGPWNYVWSSWVQSYAQEMKKKYSSPRKTWLRDEASMDLQHHDRYFCDRIQLKYIGNSRDYLILVWHSSPSKVFLYRWRRHACFYYWRGIYVDWVILSFMSADILFTYVPLGKSISCKTNTWIWNNNSPRIIAFKLVW